jgi:hypothetical protein
MKKIHQIWISDNSAPPSKFIAIRMHKLKHMYNDYEYTLYDNEMCRDQVRSLLGEEAVKLYDSLNSYSFRADLARYCILYQLGGFYFDSFICPEFKIEFDDFPVMYRSPVGSCDGYNALDNGVMYFNKPKHPFLWDAINLSLKNIKQQLYGVNALDITGPVMLGRLKEYDIRFGQSRDLDLEQQAIYFTQKGAYFENSLHWLYRPNGSFLSTFNCIGTNSYLHLWNETCVFKRNQIKFISFYTETYEQDARQLKNSLTKFGIDDSDINYREQVGSWAANTQMKAQFILEKLRENDAVVWTDADSQILQTPSFFDTISTDVGLFFIPQELALGWQPPEYSILQNTDRYLQSGTMYFKNNARVIRLLEAWIALNKKDSRQWDQWTLQLVLQNSDVSITQLPPEYVWAPYVSKVYSPRDPVIEHGQASLRIKQKSTVFVTTFSEKGYHDYGKRWIDTFIENTADVSAIIYTDFDLSIPDTRVTVLNYNQVIPEHIQWVDTYTNIEGVCTPHEKALGIKFSYKSFVMMHALNNLNGYVIWLDGDCIFKINSYANLAKSVLNDRFIAIQVDKVCENDEWKAENHAESGIVMFDADHKDKEHFLYNFTQLYEPSLVASMIRPYDGFIIMRSCGNIEYVDLLPPNYTISHCDPELTFIHPELKSRFIHYIGHKNEN